MNKGEELKVANDQFTLPTLAGALAAIALRGAIKEENEIYHVSGTSCMSRYEFTSKIADIMGYVPDNIKQLKATHLFKQLKGQ